MIIDLLKKVCKALNEIDIPYMLSGSIAMNLYTIPRMTRDIDIVLELPINKIDDFIQLFPDCYIDKDMILQEIKRNGMFYVIDSETGFKIDFILRKNTEYYQTAFQNRLKRLEFDTELYVISLNDLILAKIICIQEYQSDQQLSDIKNLLANKDKNLNYINYWIKELKLKTFGLFQNG